MPEEFDGAGEGFEQLPEDHPVLKALRAEREARKAAERKARLAEILSKYPQVGLTEEDFEGVTPDRFEAKAERLASLAGKPAGAAGRAESGTKPEPEPVREERPEEGAFARMQRTGFEGTVPQGGETVITDPSKAFALFKRNRAEFNRLREAGRIDLGTAQTDRGGSVVFHSKDERYETL